MGRKHFGPPIKKIQTAGMVSQKTHTHTHALCRRHGITQCRTTIARATPYPLTSPGPMHPIQSLWHNRYAWHGCGRRAENVLASKVRESEGGKIPTASKLWGKGNASPTKHTWPTAAQQSKHRISVNTLVINRKQKNNQPRAKRRN